ncbi:uncharacterized protein LOC143217672 [Lasioglossum baleicum]|uniref:uncharacterized protein LOC143217672 n=1 Tax=Lasioglossum baleicum TaxID=434251 RepID=UPI003FCCF8E5
MADLIEHQHTLARRISRVVSNIKKKGKANIYLELLQTGQKMLDQLWDDYRQGDTELRSAAKIDKELFESRYFVEDEYEETQEDYTDQYSLLQSLISQFKESATEKGSENSKPTVVETVAPRSRAVLPKMGLPIFGGQYKDWPSFRDLFTSLIINDVTLSPVERLHYLKACMKGSAASLLKNIKTTADNFKVAWEKLISRFENRRLLVQAQIRLLASLSPVKRESSIELQQLFDQTFDAIDALDNLDRPVTNAVDWVVELTVERLDTQSHREWEDLVRQSKELPTLEDLRTFIEGRIQTCEALEAKRKQPDEASLNKKSSSKAFKVHQISKANTSLRNCSICQGAHFVLFCPQYKEKDAVERKETASSLKLCLNCLGKHSINDCKSVKRCQKCDGKHHTTIHDVESTGAVVQHISTHVSRPSSVLLSTARVTVSGSGGHGFQARSLIDPGSEVSLISEALAQRLGVKRSQARVPLLGVGGAKAKFTRGKSTLVLSSHCDGDVKFQIPVYIISELSRYRPRNLPAVVEWPHVQGLTLADPAYHLADPVDVLLGADSYNLILREGVKRGPPHTPVAQETALGWILTGGVDSEGGGEAAGRLEVPVHHCNVDRELMEMLSRFWEQEEIDTSIPHTADDQRAEEHFVATHLRQPDGRFSVRLPFSSAPELGDSRRIALRTLESLNGRFRRSAEFHAAYTEFLKAYETLGHMAAAQHPIPSNGYYLPHHGVLREASATTKLRVVFNGSMPSSNGKSINDFLLRGPNLLPNLADVLLRWRRHAFVFSADIEKLYRQILVHPEDRRWQRILWQPEKRGGVIDYELSTVTYGLACAPYLAIRCLHQLAKVEEQRYPRGSRIVLRDIYMDDVLAGADSLPEARRQQTELRELLMAGGFPLRKWASNSRGLLDGLSSDERKGIVEWDSPTHHSVLGIKCRDFSKKRRVH